MISGEKGAKREYYFSIKRLCEWLAMSSWYHAIFGISSFMSNFHILRKYHICGVVKKSDKIASPVKWSKRHLPPFCPGQSKKHLPPFSPEPSILRHLQCPLLENDIQVHVYNGSTNVLITHILPRWSLNTGCPPKS